MGIFKSLLNAAVGAAVPPEFSGKALLKQTCKQYGVDVGRIPENAWDEMVSRCIEQARAMSNLPASLKTDHFHTELVKAVEGTAVMVSEALEPDNRSLLATGWVRDILIKHGVLGS